jgi:acetyl-CoA carboxylase biotin carboxyl carrier protein
VTDSPRSSDLQALETICRNATRLLSDLDDPPRSLRLRIGDLAVEVEFQPETTPVATVAANGNGSAHTVSLAGDQKAEDELEADGTGLHYIDAPLVGVFYRSPEPGADPFVREGDLVEVGQQVAIIEAMKMMIPIKADCAGEIRKILVEDGAPVEYDEHLLVVAPPPS